MINNNAKINRRFYEKKKYVLILIGTISMDVCAEESVVQGECGENLTWNLDTEETLTIAGKGPMTVYEFDWQKKYILIDKRF